MPSTRIQALLAAQAVLRNYVRRHRYSANALGLPLGRYVYGECWDMSYELGLAIRHLRLGLRVRLAHGVGLLVPLGGKPDPRWGDAGQPAERADSVEHYTVECHGRVLDPSAAQFGFRATGSLSDFRHQWAAVELQSWLEVEGVASSTPRGRRP